MDRLATRRFATPCSEIFRGADITCVEVEVSNPPRELAIHSGSDEVLLSTADALQMRFPADYQQFMRSSSGGEGLLGTGEYLALWPVEELIRAAKRSSLTMTVR